MNARKRTPARRLASVIVWGSLGLVLFLRLVVVRNPPPGFRPPQGPNGIFWQPPRAQFYHPPTLVQPPKGEVPKDLPRLRIDIAPSDVAALRQSTWTWGGQQKERPEVPATVHEGDTVYTNVTVHLKGAAGSFRPFDDKPALTLNFNKRAKGQHFHDFTKISLNNSVQDSTFLSEALCRELYTEAGVPAPKAAWATVILNGRDLGLYVMVEGYNKEFLRRFFKNVKGNLYDGGFCQDIDRKLAVNSGEHPDDRSDLERLVSAAHASPDIRWAQLQQVLDIDRFEKLLALEVLTANWDGYSMNRNNYRVFHDLDSDRIVFLPHGLDQMFGWPMGHFPRRREPGGGFEVRPGRSGLVARAVLSTPEGKRGYREQLQLIRQRLFKEEDVLSRVHELDTHIRPTLAAYDPVMAQQHDAQVRALCERIHRWLEGLTPENEQPPETVRFDPSGTARLTNWSQRMLAQNSMIELDQVEEADHKQLHFVAAGPGTASWRMPLELPPGRYRLEGRGRVSAEGVGSRLGLRISGSPRPTTPVTGTDWIPLKFTFHVNELSTEVVLVAEFSGNRGQAWIDTDSLQLVREHE